MTHPYWNDLCFGWGWLLWLGFIFLIFSGLGNWGYTYRAHRRHDASPRNAALAILDERYARGDIAREEYARVKSDISGAAK